MQGRPTDYKVEYNEKVYKLCLLGAIDKDIANFFDVCEATITNWKRDYPDFLASIKRGKEEADMKVAESLYKKATGKHKAKEVTFEKVVLRPQDDTSIEEEVYKKKVVVKDIPADTAAAFIWLKNRQSDKWRDKIETDNKVSIGDNLANVLGQITNAKN